MSPRATIDGAGFGGPAKEPILRYLERCVRKQGIAEPGTNLGLDFFLVGWAA